jgi:hypothetical protein
MFAGVGVLLVPLGSEVSKAQGRIWKARVCELGGTLWDQLPRGGESWASLARGGACSTTV